MFKPRKLGDRVTEMDNKVQLVHRLVQWYRGNRRDLPWRRTRDPYNIWVSETMLQQTRVETVIPYYQSFLEKFPTIEALAEAPEDVVLKMWQGLGYYSRVRNLHKAAQAVVENHGGVIPPDVEAFRSLPGVGPYTVGAVLSIAFDLPVPAVDGNVLRVLARFLCIDDPIETQAAKRPITSQVEAWLKHEAPSDVTQALMELGATICTPKSAQCGVCPLQEECRAHHEELVLSLPVRQKKKARKIVDVVAFWLEVDGTVLMEQRKNEGLLARMWQLPAIERDAEATPVDDGQLWHIITEEVPDFLSTELRVAERTLHSFEKIAEEKHIFSHIEWNVSVFRPTDALLTNQLVKSFEANRLVVRQSELGLDQLALPRVYEKIIEAELEKRQGVVESYGVYTG